VVEGAIRQVLVQRARACVRVRPNALKKETGSAMPKGAFMLASVTRAQGTQFPQMKERR